MTLGKQKPKSLKMLILEMLFFVKLIGGKKNGNKSDKKKQRKGKI